MDIERLTLRLNLHSAELLASFANIRANGDKPTLQALLSECRPTTDSIPAIKLFFLFYYDLFIVDYKQYKLKQQQQHKLLHID